MRLQLGDDFGARVTTLRYVALNPVRERLVAQAKDWLWSSTCTLVVGEDDHVVTVAPSIERVAYFAAFPGESFDEALIYAALRQAESNGRLVWSKAWLGEMGKRTGLALAPQKRGLRARTASRNELGYIGTEAPA